MDRAKKVLNVVTSILVGIVVIFAVLLVGVRFLGLTPMTVKSGSMEPTYHVGSLIYVKEKDPFELEVGEVITFMINEKTLATHRIVQVVPDPEDPTVVRFKTKGDANDVEDSGLVHCENVVGVPVFTVPKLGYITYYIQNPPGMYIALAAAGLILLLEFVPDILAEDDENRDSKKIKKKKQKDK